MKYGERDGEVSIRSIIAMGGAIGSATSIVLIGSAFVLMGPYGHPLLQSPRYVAVLVAGWFSLTIPFHLARLFLVPKRIDSAQRILFRTVLLLFILPSIIVFHLIRMEGMRKVPHNAEPIIEALHEYHRKYDRWPPALRSLVPEFLQQVPTTGVGGFPEFSYSVSDMNGDISENPWTLWIETPQSFLNFDCMLYWPNQDYPDYAHGGYLHPIGTWAYVHE